MHALKPSLEWPPRAGTMHPANALCICGGEGAIIDCNASLGPRLTVLQVFPIRGPQHRLPAIGGQGRGCVRRGPCVAGAARE
jgi:hypothetical protein